MYGVHCNSLKNTAALGILLTEEDVRERVNLRRQNLGDHPAFGCGKLEHGCERRRLKKVAVLGRDDQKRQKTGRGNRENQ